MIDSSQPRADALVLFGATGDLAKRKLFPALYHLEQTGVLDVPVIGVARSDWTDELVPRARPRGDLANDPTADGGLIASLQGRLDLIQGDYAEQATWEELRATLDRHGSCNAVYYMAIPPSMFPEVATAARVRRSQRARPDRRREAVRPRPGERPGAERDAGGGVPGGADLPDRPLPRQGERRGPARVPVLEHAARTGLEPPVRPQRAGHDVRDDRRRGARFVLRRRRRDPRRAPEPPAPGRGAARDGAAGRLRLAVPPGREGQGHGGHAADRSRRARPRSVRRLPGRAGRRGRFVRRDVRCREAR